eukprot:363378-Chlamydomonas_euryale.AAC.12
MSAPLPCCDAAMARTTASIAIATLLAAAAAHLGRAWRRLHSVRPSPKLRVMSDSPCIFSAAR